MIYAVIAAKGDLEFTHFLNAKVDFTPINKG